MELKFKPKKEKEEKKALYAPKESILPSVLYKKLGFDNAKAVAIEKPFKVFTGKQNEFEMIPIPAGKYMRGKKDDEKASPVKEIEVSAFWMGKYEVTWDEYEAWQFSLEIARRSKEYKATALDQLADLVSRPTGPYLDMSFGMGTQSRADKEHAGSY